MFFFFNTKLSENESEDEGVNGAASLLSVFKTIVTTNSWCEPKIISLFEATKEQKFDQELAEVIDQELAEVMSQSNEFCSFFFQHKT